MASKSLLSVIFDTSIWIAFFLEGDSFHYYAVRKVRMYEKRAYQIFVPITVLVEIITVLSNKGIDINQIKKLVKTFFNTENYTIQNLEGKELIELALHHSTKVKLKALDYHIYLYYIKFKPTKFETYDKQLSKSINIINNEDLN